MDEELPNETQQLNEEPLLLHDDERRAKFLAVVPLVLLVHEQFQYHVLEVALVVLTHEQFYNWAVFEQPKLLELVPLVVFTAVVLTYTQQSQFLTVALPFRHEQLALVMLRFDWS